MCALGPLWTWHITHRNWGPSCLSGGGEFTEMVIVILWKLKLTLMLMLAPGYLHPSRPPHRVVSGRRNCPQGKHCST